MVWPLLGAAVAGGVGVAGLSAFGSDDSFSDTIEDATEGAMKAIGPGVAGATRGLVDVIKNEFKDNAVGFSMTLTIGVIAYAVYLTLRKELS
jgi:uncharacterized membrane protein YebE (DUF533 family)